MIHLIKSDETVLFEILTPPPASAIAVVLRRGALIGVSARAATPIAGLNGFGLNIAKSGEFIFFRSVDAGGPAELWFRCIVTLAFAHTCTVAFGPATCCCS